MHLFYDAFDIHESVLVVTVGMMRPRGQGEGRRENQAKNEA
jgi:hypothetical protein